MIKKKFPPLISLPLYLWFIFLLLIPIGIVIAYSFLKKGPYGGIVFEPTLENYLRSGDQIYLIIYFKSIKLAFLTALSCLLIGYPMAYAMATAKKTYRPFFLIAIIIPFLTNLIIKAYAFKILLGINGPINKLLLALQIIAEPLTLTNNQYSILLGMITNYLPFMVLPLYVVIEKFDFALLEAARDLGARSWHVIFKILLPLTKSGIITGFILVFIPALGEFVIPDLFGGAKTMLIGNLITEQFLKTRDWPFGAALSVLLLILVLLSLALQTYLSKGRNKIRL